MQNYGTVHKKQQTALCFAVEQTPVWIISFLATQKAAISGIKIFLKMFFAAKYFYLVL